MTEEQKFSIRQTQNPHLNEISHNYDEIIVHFIEHVKIAMQKNTINILDIGGGKGYGKIMYDRDDVNYFCLDLNSSRQEQKITYIKGDITSDNLIFQNTFDIIFTKDTFEHILNPWDATKNVVNNLNELGVFIFLAPFSWRYHASPYDTYRYTHTGVQYLFERFGKMKKVFSGYVKCGDVGGRWQNKKDFTIDDEVFPKCLEVIYVGEKKSNHKFNLNDLDSDSSWHHEI